jgi:hypothetical protein
VVGVAGCAEYGADGQPERLSLDHPLALRQDALRPRPEKDHDEQADRHPLK